jgi:hypothetical protein
MYTNVYFYSVCIALSVYTCCELHSLQDKQAVAYAGCGVQVAERTAEGQAAVDRTFRTVRKLQNIQDARCAGCRRRRLCLGRCSIHRRCKTEAA